MLLAKELGEHLTIATDTITVNGIEVPAPYRGPMKNGQEYWVADRSHEEYAVCMSWQGDFADSFLMRRGLIYLNKQSAAAHGRAMAAASSQEGGAA